MFSFLKKKTKSQGIKLVPLTEAQISGLTDFMDDVDLNYELPETRKPGSAITLEVYFGIKDDLAIKGSCIGYRNNQQIANHHGVSAETVRLIGKAKSFADYRNLRKARSAK